MAAIFYDEIFVSISGESSSAGIPTVFVRLYGCGIKCLYCDTRQDHKKRKRISFDHLLNCICRFKIPHICITGGEPLLQWGNIYPLVLELVSRGKHVEIETSGCVPIDYDPYNRSFKYIMDIKCPSSGVSHKNKYENLMNLLPKDEVKFVISNEEDYNFMKNILRNYPTSASILVSPCFNKHRPIIGKRLVDWILRDRLYNVRVSLQIHKILHVK